MGEAHLIWYIGMSDGTLLGLFGKIEHYQRGSCVLLFLAELC